MEMMGVCHVDGSCNGAKCLVLDKLKTVYIGFAGGGKPDGRSVCNDGFYQAIVGDGQGLLLLAPGRASQRFEDV